jgi:hypothetical protein
VPRQFDSTDRCPVRTLGIVAIALNVLWLLVVLFFVGSQGVGDYDVVGFVVLALIVVTPLVNLLALARVPASTKRRGQEENQESPRGT